MSRILLTFLLSAAVFAGWNAVGDDAPAPADKPAEAKPAEAKPEAKPAAKKAPEKPPAPRSKYPRIRTGSIIKAEFSSDKPDADSQSPIAKKSSSAWAVLTIDLDPGRAASIFDYVLQKDGTEYPCLDLADGADRFEGKLRNYSSVDGKKCRMAFAVPSADGEYEVVFKLDPGDGNTVKVKNK